MKLNRGMNFYKEVVLKVGNNIGLKVEVVEMFYKENKEELKYMNVVELVSRLKRFNSNNYIMLCGGDWIKESVYYERKVREGKR